MAICTPPCCAIFSACGAVFLGLMGWVIAANPVYIKGLEDPASTPKTW